MPHTITQEPAGFEVRVTGTLLIDEAVEILDDLDDSDGAPDHDYELVDLSAADPLDFEFEDLHLIARRACLSPRRPGVRLALVGPRRVVGSHTREYAHMLGTWMKPATWDVADFSTVAEARRWIAEEHAAAQ